jgi:DNA-binding HxlR family transcriptional regulator
MRKSTMRRTYGQYCGLARALDVVGDRWTLLIIRQLLLGPARYGQLLQGLPGIATNLLSDRLRDLEEAGIIERRLSDRHNAVVYAPTPWGGELREPIESLVRWSTPLMVRGPEGDTFRDEWLVLALRALLAGTTSTRSTTVGIETDEELIGLRVTPTGVEVDRAESREQFDATVRADPPVILGLAAGELTLDQVAADIIIDGEEQAVRTAFD